jgi:hypothetical protein
MSLFTPYNVCDYYVKLAVDALVEQEAKPVEVAYVSFGLPPYDNVCGQLTVSPELVYRSIIFPTESVDAEICDGGSIALNLLLTLVRCVPTLSDSGVPPTAEAIAEAHNSVYWDAAVLWNALTGPLPDDEWERASVTQTPVDTSGGAVGVEFRWTIGLPEDQWCVSG